MVDVDTQTLEHGLLLAHVVGAVAGSLESTKVARVQRGVGLLLFFDRLNPTRRLALQLCELALGGGEGIAPGTDLALDVEQLHESQLEALLREALGKIREALSLLLLHAETVHFGVGFALLGGHGHHAAVGLFIRLRRRHVGLAELVAAADDLDHLRELLRPLLCDGLDLVLEHKEVLETHVDVAAQQEGLQFLVRHSVAVELDGRAVGRGLESARDLVLGSVDGEDDSDGGVRAASCDEIAIMGDTHVVGCDSEAESDGVCDVAFARAVGSDHAGKVAERSDRVGALVGLEVVHLNAHNVRV
eukprot:PhM_4_TR13266/c0_g1_i1/m.48551